MLLWNAKEKNIEDSVRKVECFYFVEILELHLEKRLFWSMLKYSIRPRLRPSVVRDLNGNSGRSDGDYLWSTQVFVRVANMTGGGLGCPASDVNPRHLDEMPPSTRTRWKFPGDGSSPWQHSASKYVWWSDTHEMGRMNCELPAPNCLSFPEHSLNIVYKDDFPPPQITERSYYDLNAVGNRSIVSAFSDVSKHFEAKQKRN